jgi:hypothetical protein
VVLAARMTPPRRNVQHSDPAGTLAKDEAPGSAGFRGVKFRPNAQQQRDDLRYRLKNGGEMSPHDQQPRKLSDRAVRTGSLRVPSAARASGPARNADAAFTPSCWAARQQAGQRRLDIHLPNNLLAQHNGDSGQIVIVQKVLAVQFLQIIEDQESHFGIHAAKRVTPINELSTLRPDDAHLTVEILA